MARQAELFPKPKRRYRWLMHVEDAGHHGTLIVVLRCQRCDHSTGWVEARTVTESKYGYPCPNCNRGEP